MHMDLADAWNYILSGLDVVGLVALRAVGKKNANGWLWAMFTQAVWMVYSVSTLQWGFLAVAAVKLGVYTWNWTSWLRSDKAEAKPKTHEELAFDLAKQILPDANGVTQIQAANFLTKAIRAAELYPEKTRAAA
ncbi:hypothetical protein AB0L54_35755 [Streptomyces sp. NPDC052196]|uniref:hypothetical protein n=1 Tax=Streptomyces sp. NPDC052196 TaxID=3156691 RepID=UPI003438ABA4